MKKFFRGIFSATADVDYFPPESQLLVENPEATVAPNEVVASTDEGNAGVSGLVSEERQPQHVHLSTETDGGEIGSPGPTDEYRAWSQSFEAFHQAIFHTVVYFAMGVLAYSFLLDTKWHIVDSLYFSVVIFTTVGYGDLCPNTTQGQMFTIFFAIYGIIILGIFLGILGDMMVERQQHKRQNSMEKARRQYLQTFQHGTYQQGNHPSMETMQEENPVVESCFKIYCEVCLKNIWAIVILFAVAIPVILIEKWDFAKGIYWMVITSTTIGLGDETPSQALSKGLCILYIPLAVYLVGRFLGLVATTFLDQQSRKAEQQFLNRALTLSDIKRMDLNDDGGVSREEFLVYMLITLQKVNEDDIKDIIAVYSKLDKTGDGVLNSADLATEVKRSNEVTTGLQPGAF
ncbi:ion channel [Nitzschia inconspicua]|uniref:Ion channel n=1 Tax=Nitzschia inconspicua TaxID=303405 RepID=A0A9K3PN64_9STRA|nr:ion channel [Nitzschia inconspicua]